MYKTFFLFIGFSFALAQEYGPELPLEALAPEVPTEYEDHRNFNYRYEDWYTRFGNDLNNDSDKEELELNLKPNAEFMDRMKKKAVDGGFNVNREIKNLSPYQFQGELIIRY